MQFWERFRYKNREQQLSFHLVCCAELDEWLDKIEETYFADFESKERAQVVNALLTAVEPVLLRQLNLDSYEWEFSLTEGESPLSESRNGEKVLMKQEMRVLLDKRIYRLLKKLHEAGDRGFLMKRPQGGTFSMALVLRAVLVSVFRLLEVVGRDGLLLWVKEWQENYEKENEGETRRISHHMVAFKGNNVKFISHYDDDYRYLHLFHPPPDKE